MIPEGIFGPMTVQAGEDLAQYRRVKIESGTVTDPPEVVYADAGEDGIGVTVDAVSDGGMVTIVPLPWCGAFFCTAADSFSRGATLYAAADGKVSDTVSGSPVAIAYQAATAAGDVVLVISWSVKSTTAAATSVADAAGLTDNATVETVLAEILTSLKSAQATIPIPLGAITMEDGTVLTKQATTVAGFSQLSDKELVINIPVDCTSGEALGFSVPVPQDLDDSAAVNIHVLAGKAADNDVLTLDCEVYPVAAGDTANADIQDTAAQAITQAASELVFECGADGVLAAPGALTGVLTLGGTNDGDAVYIYGVWVEYTRTLLTS